MLLGISEAIGKLSHDHIAFRRMLNVLDRQVAAVAQYHAPDYDVLLGVVSYLETYPGKYHHPVEDLIYDAICKRRPKVAADVAHVAAEHGEIAARFRNFAAVVQAIMSDVEVSRTAFCVTAREFIAFERKHIREEETVMFALANRWLTNEDWFEIDMAMRKLCAPLSGPEGQRFEKLHADIVAWDFEDQKNIVAQGPVH
jgi:hemerythrin-like domain-containing protein